jgi:hypothetical protein
MDKTQITRSEYQQLLGLFVLAKRHQTALAEILNAVVEITGEGRDDGHCSDQVYGSDDPNVDALLKKLGITVADREGH